jgi:hypothetical protein
MHIWWYTPKISQRQVAGVISRVQVGFLQRLCRSCTGAGHCETFAVQFYSTIHDKTLSAETQVRVENLRKHLRLFGRHG